MRRGRDHNGGPGRSFLFITKERGLLNMKELGFIAFPAIVVICYLAGATLKAINCEKLDKFIPVICGTIGGIIGVIVFNTIPNYIPADNWLMALAIGIVSGFAATGINQVYKQFSEAEYFYEAESEDEIDEPEDEEESGAV